MILKNQTNRSAILSLKLYRSYLRHFNSAIPLSQGWNPGLQNQPSATRTFPIWSLANQRGKSFWM